MIYAIIKDGKVINTVIWDGDVNLFDGYEFIVAPKGVGIGWGYDGNTFTPLNYDANSD